MLNIIIFIFGLCLGSFLNVVICRLKTKESIIKSRSHCPDCHKVLKWHDLIPVLSFVWQKGRCRYCGQRISWQYPLVEISTGLLFLLVFNFQFSNFSQSPTFQLLNLIYYFFIISVLIVVFVYDLKHYIIPDQVIYPAIVIGLIFNFNSSNFKNFILSALGASLFFFLIVLLTKGKGMGMGDVKLAFLMGLILGWPGIFAALIMAFFSGALVGMGLLAAGKKKIKSEIPFGPFLAGSTILILLLGQYLSDWYRMLYYF